jgi:hypothetical protein
MNDVTDLFRAIPQEIALSCCLPEHVTNGPWSDLKTRVYGQLWPQIDARICRVLFRLGREQGWIEIFSLERE